jgi:hypothetical protein
MIEICKTDSSNSENIFKLEQYLNNVEVFTVQLAKDRLGKKKTEEWLKKINATQRQVCLQIRKSTDNFPIKFAPKEQWIKIKVSDELPNKKIIQLAKKLDLKYEIQKEKYILIFGDEKKVKKVVKEIAKINRKS